MLVKLLLHEQSTNSKRSYSHRAMSHSQRQIHKHLTCKSAETSTSLMVVREERYRSAPKEASGKTAYCKTLSVRSMSESSLCICLATIFTLRGLAMHLIVVFPTIDLPKWWVGEGIKLTRRWFRIEFEVVVMRGEGRWSRKEHVAIAGLSRHGYGIALTWKQNLRTPFIVVLESGFCFRFLGICFIENEMSKKMNCRWFSGVDYVL